MPFTIEQLANLFNQPLENNTQPNDNEKNIKEQLLAFAQLQKSRRQEKDQIKQVELDNKIKAKLKDLIGQLKPLFNQKDKLINSFYLIFAHLTKELASLLSKNIKSSKDNVLIKLIIKELSTLIALYEAKETCKDQKKVPTLEKKIKMNIASTINTFKCLTEEFEIAEIFYQILTNLTVLAPLNKQDDDTQEFLDPLTLCSIDQAKQVYTSHGYIFDAPFLFQHLEKEHNYKNPVNYEGFSKLDLQAISQVAQKPFISIPQEIETHDSEAPSLSSAQSPLVEIYSSGIPYTGLVPPSLHGYFAVIDTTSSSQPELGHSNESLNANYGSTAFAEFLWITFIPFTGYLFADPTLIRNPMFREIIQSLLTALNENTDSAHSSQTYSSIIQTLNPNNTNTQNSMPETNTSELSSITSFNTQRATNTTTNTSSNTLSHNQATILSLVASMSSLLNSRTDNNQQSSSNTNPRPSPPAIEEVD